jgi:hypothetical protein
MRDFMGGNDAIGRIKNQCLSLYYALIKKICWVRLCCKCVIWLRSISMFLWLIICFWTKEIGEPVARDGKHYVYSL